jgi:hypothetical protein
LEIFSVMETTIKLRFNSAATALGSEEASTVLRISRPDPESRAM